MIDKMKFCDCFGFAVIAENLGSNHGILFRHWLAFKKTVNSNKIILHITKWFEADWALIRVFDVFAMAHEMNTMTTSHKHNRRKRCEKEFTTDGTITFQISFNAFMLSNIIIHKTDIAFVTVIKILPFPDSTHFAFITMVNLLLLIIVPKFANVTVVICHDFLTVHIAANVWSLLFSFAVHTKHLFSRIAVIRMIFHFIMAKSTRNPFLTTFSELFTISHIVFTSHYRVGMQGMESDNMWTICLMNRRISSNRTIGRAKQWTSW